MTGRLFERARWLEGVSLILISVAATAYTEWPIITRSMTFEPDAAIHEWYMRSFQNPELFTDPLTRAFIAAGYEPPGFEFLYRIASNLIDPVTLAEWVPLLLAPLSVWLLFRIVRFHMAWKPAAWISAGSFLFSWDVLRFSGGHGRAFAYPILLGTVLLALHHRDRLAAFVPPIGFLIYPQAGAVALGVLFLSSLRWERGPRFEYKRALLVVLSGALVVAAYVGPKLLSDHDPPHLVSVEEARSLVEFSPEGPAHFFRPSLEEYLEKNYSGFNLDRSGNILAVAALALMLLRPRTLRLLRKELVALPVASLIGFGLAWLLLFRLYLPHRFTYGLLPFFCAFVGIALAPAAKSLFSKRPALAIPSAILFPAGTAVLALTFFPLGPDRPAKAIATMFVNHLPAVLATFGVAIAIAIATVSGRRSKGLKISVVGLATTVAGVLFIGTVGIAGERSSPRDCEPPELFEYLAGVPEDAVIAGDPFLLDCVTLASKRAVLISRKLYQPWESTYFEIARERMTDMVAAYYGDSIDDLIELRAKYDADYLVTRLPLRARGGFEPFTSMMRDLLAVTDRRIVRRLPKACERFRSANVRVWDLACIEVAPIRISDR